MKNFHCDHCNQHVSYENVSCERCGHVLGFVEYTGQINAFVPDGGDTWRSLAPDIEGRRYRQCHNYAVNQVCNRMIARDDPQTLCQACRLTTIIPSLASQQNRKYWYRLERAKRRMLDTLVQLDLPVVPRHDDPQRGLAFEFLEYFSGGPPVHTGHNDGLITINIAEADDAHRASTRVQMDERHRTLLGHFRHEIGHYYFMRLVEEGPMIDQCRALFGDDRLDYGEALQHHYKSDPPEHWQASYVSAYATMHPYEDWADGKAHYMHMVDTLDTATACGMALEPEHSDEPSMSADPLDADAPSFRDIIQRWLPLTDALNRLNRSMGTRDSYPFTLTKPVLHKLWFVHQDQWLGAGASHQTGWRFTALTDGRCRQGVKTSGSMPEAIASMLPWRHGSTAEPPQPAPRARGHAKSLEQTHSDLMLASCIQSGRRHVAHSIPKRSNRMKMHCAAVLLASLAPLCAQAQQPEPPGQWRIGVGVAVRDTLYAGQDSRVLAFPLIDYEGERFYWTGLDVGYRLIDRDGFKLNGFVGARLDGMDADDFGTRALVRNGIDRRLLDERDNAINAGMSAIWTGQAGELELSAETDISGASDGYRGAIEYRHPLQIGVVRLVPSIGIKLLSRDVADYYYGTLPEEVARGVIDYRPGRSTIPHAGIAAIVPFTVRWASVVAVEVERYPSDIADSPLIEPGTDLVPTVFVGILRSF